MQTNDVRLKMPQSSLKLQLSCRKRLRRLSLIVASSILLAACATTNGIETTKIKPICDALVGPIQYDSRNPKDPRFAGRVLAPDLAVRNKIGGDLDCPAYR